MIGYVWFMNVDMRVDDRHCFAFYLSGEVTQGFLDGSRGQP